MIRALTTSAAALALLSVPSLAAAAPATSSLGVSRASALSLTPSQRAGTASTKTTKLSQEGSIIAAVLAIGVIAGGVILIADNDDDPDSP